MLPCRNCGKPVTVPIDQSPLKCLDCDERTPVVWFRGPRAFDYFILWCIKTGRIRESETSSPA